FNFFSSVKPMFKFFKRKKGPAEPERVPQTEEGSQGGSSQGSPTHVEPAGLATQPALEEQRPGEGLGGAFADAPQGLNESLLQRPAPGDKSDDSRQEASSPDMDEVAEQAWAAGDAPLPTPEQEEPLDLHVDDSAPPQVA